ncbi:MAG TPA: peptidoglycan recognition family protein [Streptosporangiaceae bacterium]|nr:peptidoglycan recognition family protein [Streptosporangiaceae bacterium]
MVTTSTYARGQLLPGHRLVTMLAGAAAAAVLVALGAPGYASAAPRSTAGSGAIVGAAKAAQQRFGVPAVLLEAICYFEGHLSGHGGAPSSEGGYGCMDLARNNHLDTLDQAAKLLSVPVSSVRHSQRLNIAGAAAVLRADAISLSGAHRIPATPGGWYGAIAEYSGAEHGIAARYADEVYRIIRTGLTATAPTGETVRIPPTAVTPDTATAAHVGTKQTLPANCATNPGVDYTPAYNCIVPTSYAGVTYDTASRPSDLPLLAITVHDTEETLDNTIATFWNESNGVSIHYVVDTDGTVYQCLHEKDVAFQNGNFWYNQRTIGIEHVGVDATGYEWYNATQYLGSAKLVAYLLTKYNIPLDHEHVMSHGTTPAPTLGTSPNHVDPGPYWLWDYYLGLINQQGVPFATGNTPSGVIRLNPASGQQPDGSNGTETTANFNFFYLYTQPSTASPLLHSQGSPGDVTDESNNVETMISYATLSQQPDAAGTGDTMYEIWYGAALSSSSWTTTGTKAWIAVPPGAAEQGYGTVVTLSGSGGKSAHVYGKPGGTSGNVIGSTPARSAYLSPWSVTVSGTTWYAINSNHRQAWVPASEVTSTRRT